MNNNLEIFKQYLSEQLSYRHSELINSAADKDIDYIRKKFGHYETTYSLFQDILELEKDPSKFCKEKLDNKDSSE